MPSASLRYLAIICALAAPLALPAVLNDIYLIHGVLCRILVFAIVVISLDLIIGYLGDISLGHAGFFGLGAYTVAILTATPLLNDSAERTMQFFPQLPFAAALLVGVIVAGGAGFLLAFPALRIKGHYLAVTTLAYGLIIHHLIKESEVLTNGTKGIHLPRLQLFGVDFSETGFFWLAYPAAVAVMWMVHQLTSSYWGRAFSALKSSDIAAECCGIGRARHKVVAFTLSAAIAGFGGGLFSQLDSYVGPNAFTIDSSFFLVMMLICGGVRSRLGVLLGVAMLIWLPAELVGFEDYRLSVFSLVLMLTLFFFPHGAAGVVNGFWARFVTPQRTGQTSKRGSLRAARERDELIALAEKESSPLLYQETAMDNAFPVLRLDSISKKFGGVHALDQVDMEVRSGSIHGLIGPNGSGKTTALNLISGIFPVTSGQIVLNGADITQLKSYQRAIAGVGRTFQNLELFNELSVLENVMVGLHKSFKSPFVHVLTGSRRLRNEEKTRRVHAYRLLQLVELHDVAFRKVTELSYGQLRRLDLARALAGNPRLLLLDEPAAGFNLSEVQALNRIILKVRDLGVTILVIDHRMDLIMKICDRITVLNFGRKTAEDTPAMIQKNPDVISAYLGTEKAAA